MADVARLRRLAVPTRASAWSTGAHEEEARAYLQARLTLFTKLIFTAIVTLMAFLLVMYAVYPIAPHHNDLIFGGASAELTVMALIWRGLLVRRSLSVQTLYRIDLIYAMFIGISFGVSAALSEELRPAAYAALVYGSFTVFTRALVVPSSGRRTAILSTVLWVPMVAAAVWLGATSEQELPGPAFVLGSLMFGTVAIALATTGSRIIYGLRRQVSEAMQLGQYTLDRKIGEGGNGAVYRARHALLRRPTAVKLLLPDKVGADNLDRFEREVQHMSQLTHPNTVAVFDYGRSPDGVLYYAMEYLDGVDLENLVRLHGPQPSSRVIDILVQVCGALQEAHDAGIIHRDIKPANIILCERGGVPDVAKVVDFGLVKEIARDSGASTQIVLGTPAYVAPEAVTDPDRIGPAVDLYALGCVGYFLLTGRRVFEGKTAVDLCVQHVTATPRRPTEDTTLRIPPELEDLVLRCLAKDPADRYPSAAALAEALESIPRLPDWSRTDARRWWRDLSARQTSAPSTAAPTLTITVDLGDRA
jgi:eukaryotic-like serine/threonine-protein kinase